MLYIVDQKLFIIEDVVSKGTPPPFICMQFAMNVIFMLLGYKRHARWTFTNEMTTGTERQVHTVCRGGREGSTSSLWTRVNHQNRGCPSPPPTPT